jgi:flagellar motor component MotA
VPFAHAGRTAHCPSCDKRIKIPLPSARAPDAADAAAHGGRPERQAWKEADPSNPSLWLSLAISFGVLLLVFAVVGLFRAPAGKPTAEYTTMQFIASLLFSHFTVSVLNCGLFIWSMTVLGLKHGKIRHQRAALMLDVLPLRLGKEITAANVTSFIDHVYALPEKLRDSLMVNRIRKALELFEVRQNISDVREMMVSQSEIDFSRINGSYALPRACLWGIPLLGFIGTVVGLSHAIAGMNFSNVEDIAKILGAINNVTSGLGTAFDATLLGLVLALILNFPISSMAKQEDSNLQTIDAFCNEVLLPRLKDSEAAHLGGEAAAALAEAIARSIANTQQEFLAGLSQLVRQMHEYGANLDSRMESFQRLATTQFVTKTDEMREESRAALEEHLCLANRYLGGLDAGIGGLNKVLQELGEKHITVTPPKKRRWWSGHGA